MASAEAAAVGCVRAAVSVVITCARSRRTSSRAHCNVCPWSCCLALMTRAMSLRRALARPRSSTTRTCSTAGTASVVRAHACEYLRSAGAAHMWATRVAQTRSGDQCRGCGQCVANVAHVAHAWVVRGGGANRQPRRARGSVSDTLHRYEGFDLGGEQKPNKRARLPGVADAAASRSDSIGGTPPGH